MTTPTANFVSGVGRDDSRLMMPDISVFLAFGLRCQRTMAAVLMGWDLDRGP